MLASSEVFYSNIIRNHVGSRFGWHCSIAFVIAHCLCHIIFAPPVVAMRAAQYVMAEEERSGRPQTGPVGGGPVDGARSQAEEEPR